MFTSGSHNLKDHVEAINALNVFPVPDGDTGTNMSLTMTSGVRQIQNKGLETVGELTSQFAKGLLMGARGNSGVILSQLFRGFSTVLKNEKESTDAEALANAFQAGVDTAYKAVMKPVEGTILTVAREAAKAGLQTAKKTKDVLAVMQAVVGEA
ncbi:MAG TPA: DAK2 domain-containing protein, partial [Sporolactobacillaceae bacterium]|nr:DAK2 domain-containing protein [Sporolactobacillaceae bacterium]